MRLGQKPQPLGFWSINYSEHGKRSVFANLLKIFNSVAEDLPKPGGFARAGGGFAPAGRRFAPAGGRFARLRGDFPDSHRDSKANLCKGRDPNSQASCWGLFVGSVLCARAFRRRPSVRVRRSWREYFQARTQLRILDRRTNSPVNQCRQCEVSSTNCHWVVCWLGPLEVSDGNYYRPVLTHSYEQIKSWLTRRRTRLNNFKISLIAWPHARNILALGYSAN